MKTFKAWLILTGLLFGIAVPLFVGANAVLWAWQNSRRLKDTPETKSAFLTNYNPEHVIQPFLCTHSFGQGSRNGGGADNNSVSHDVGFFWSFAMRSDKESDLMSELNDDVYDQLILNGARVLNRSGNLSTGFRYDYALGNTTGTVTIPPIQSAPAHRATPLPSGVVDVLAKVDLKEQWFPEEQALLPSASDSSR
jgi:hypothetical protein